METFLVFKVSYLYLQRENLHKMKEAILEKAKDMYIKLGFKGVTLDDIAQEMNISKKTIYQHYSNKNELIEAVAKLLLNTISCDIDGIMEMKYDPIDELFQIRKHLRKTLEGDLQVPIFQLSKFFPEISKHVRDEQFAKMHDGVKENLIRGVKDGLYRPDINVEFISRIYFTGVAGTKDADIFPESIFNVHEVTKLYLEYHLRAICTQKGINTLETHLAEAE